jgi:hypothetical protein
LPGRFANPMLWAYVLGFVFVAIYIFHLSIHFTVLIGLAYVVYLLYIRI